MKKETTSKGFYRIYKEIDYPKFDILSFKIGVEWQQERSYSEEEVYDLIHKRDIFWTRYKNTYSQDYISTKDWFEQFKKK